MTHAAPFDATGNLPGSPAPGRCFLTVVISFARNDDRTRIVAILDVETVPWIVARPGLATPVRGSRSAVVAGRSAAVLQVGQAPASGPGGSACLSDCRPSTRPATGG